jgi:deazaflavin-dependent oxidoreductase (nitroreductase family)
MAERSRQLNPVERMLERFAATRPGGWFFVNIGNRIDPTLMRLSRGHLSTGLGQQVLLLTHTGARSGKRRDTPLLYMTDGEDLILIASKAGNEKHPAWYHNLNANPQVDVLAPRRSGAYTAHEAEGAERERLWAKAVDYYTGYDIYQDRAGARRIPVIVLSPAGAG